MYQKDLFTEDGERIISLEEVNIFCSPYLVFDILQKKEKTPDIKIFEDINILKEIDFFLYAKPILKEESWAKRQKYILHLMPREAPTEENFKILIKLPANHYFEVDKANSKIRLVGPFINKNGVGNWLNF